MSSSVVCYLVLMCLRNGFSMIIEVSMQIVMCTDLMPPAEGFNSEEAEMGRRTCAVLRYLDAV